MYLVHHGILGQEWGKRNGPPYPLKGGDYSQSEERKILAKRKRVANTIYNKKHYDEVLKADKTTLSTVSYDKNRTKDTDMFYAATNFFDTHQYNGFFNQKMPKDLYDSYGAKLGNGRCYKFQIRNGLKTDVKVASEDSGAKMFADLYKKDRDFYNFVTDSNRMMKYFDERRLHHKGYKEAADTLDKIRAGKDITSNDVKDIYKLFNFVIPYDGGGTDKRGSHDVAVQRAKFFKLAKKNGYGALLDTNDAIYNNMHAKQPVIMFDMSAVVPKEAYQTKASDVIKSRAVAVFRKVLNAHQIKV